MSIGRHYFLVADGQILINQPAICMNDLKTLACLIVLSICLIGCKENDEEAALPNVALTSVATSTSQWTGVAVSQEKRLFVNWPRMTTDTVPYSVAEVSGGQMTPFPDAEWNTWNATLPPQNHFVCVQSVYVDDQNFLWVLDPANPQSKGVVKGGPKLLKFDLQTKQLMQRIDFDTTVVFGTSYLNDVRVDTQKKFAYITDSDRGALVVVNLTTGKSRRVLGNDPSTKSENLILTVEGRTWRRKDGTLPSIHSDGIALSPQRDFLYYHALTGKGLYRIGTQWLQDESLSESQLSGKVEKLTDTEPIDGMMFGPGGYLYLTYIQQNAIYRYKPGGKLQQVAQSEQLKWPDTFAVGPDSTMYVTTSQLHIPMNERTEPYQVLQFTPQNTNQ